MAQNKKVAQKLLEYYFYTISKGIRPKKVGAKSMTKMAGDFRWTSPLVAN